MLYAVKANREIAISDDEAGFYLDAGFDIYDVDKKGKPFLKEAANADEVSRLKQEIAELKQELQEKPAQEKPAQEKPATE